MSEVHQAQGGEGAHDYVRDPLVAFRFGIPALPNGYVERPRLVTTMERGATQPLLLVSAGAGTGKTSLVADWAARRDPEQTAWITFEPGDVNAAAFWASVLAQLHAHGVPAAATPQVPGAAGVPPAQLAEIASTLSARVDTLVLVLDGWEFTTPAVTRGVDFLLRHSGHRLVIVIVTRSDPVLPLPRYRLNDLVTEVRTADLAFTQDEVHELVGSGDLTLTEQSVEALVARTQGWVAGVRFATSSLLRQSDPDAAVLQLAGDTGNIAEYLVAEVLDTRSDAERELLLATCVVDVLRPGLIEELAGPTAPRGLAQLAHANAFVETVSDQPGWYRYHPLFRELLRAELNHLAPARSIALHRRAGHWHAERDMLGTAVRHAAAGYQWTEAAEYVVDDLAVGSLLQSCASDSLCNALRSMPDSAQGPAAAIVRAALALSDGDTSVARHELEHARDGSPGRTQRVANALIDALMSLQAPDAAQALEICVAAEHELQGQSLERLAAHPELVAMVVAARATALLRSGQVRAGRVAFTRAAELATAPGCGPALVYSLSHLALLDALEGALRRGADRAVRAREVGHDQGVNGFGLHDASLVAQSWIALQQGDAGTARERIDTARSAEASYAVLPTQFLELASAKLARMDGDLARATHVLQDVREQASASAPWVADLAVEEQIACAVSTGDAAVAHDLAMALSGRDDTGALLSAARLRLCARIAGGATDPVGPIATRPDEPLVARVTAGLLVAEGELQRGQQEQARASVQRATRLAAPEKLRLPFHEAAPAVRDLIPRRRPTAPIPRQGSRQAAQADDAAPVIETLTAKELEVLNHLSQLLTTDEIAAAMFVSVNTVRTHVRSILRKLSVSRRHQAVRRARVLEIIDNH